MINPLRLGKFALWPRRGCRVAIGLLALALIASCGLGNAYLGDQPNAAAAIGVRWILEQPQAYGGRELVLDGVVVGLDQRAGRFFYLRDERGGLFVELAPSATWSVPSDAERRHALVAGRLERDAFNRWYLLASGISLGRKAF